MRCLAGQTGFGKSWTVTSLIQRTIKTMPKSHLILLDLHGEYCWEDEAGNIQSAFPDKSVNYVEVTKLEMPYWMMTYAELIDLFIDRAASIQMVFMREVLQ